MINKIEGTYQIEKVVSIVDGGESVVNYTNSTMSFSECKLKDQTVQQCAGYYQVEGSARITFDYRPERDGGKEMMNINSFDFDSKPYFGGFYKIEDRKNNSLTLVRQRHRESDKPDIIIYLKR